MIVDTTTGQETAFQQVQTNTGDSYQDVEVEFNADGSVGGYVVGGLGWCPDTDPLGCTAQAAGHCNGWCGVALKLSSDLQSTLWRTVFIPV